MLVRKWRAGLGLSQSSAYLITCSQVFIQHLLCVKARTRTRYILMNGTIVPSLWPPTSSLCPLLWPSTSLSVFMNEYKRGEANTIQMCLTRNSGSQTPQGISTWLRACFSQSQVAWWHCRVGKPCPGTSQPGCLAILKEVPCLLWLRSGQSQVFQNTL